MTVGPGYKRICYLVTGWMIGVTFTVVQVGDGHVDHAYWGRPEQMTMFRPSFSIAEDNPGSDLAGETSAAMAAGSLIFRETGKCAIHGTTCNQAHKHPKL